MRALRAPREGVLGACSVPPKGKAMSASGFPSPSTEPPPQPSVVPSACRAGDPLTNVYHPYRLRVLDQCKTITGRVTSIRHELDGDVHFDLELDPEFKDLLMPGNYARHHGWLVIEIVPADEPGCTPGQAPRTTSGSYDYGTCTGAAVATPPLGSRVQVTGPYVDDIHHSGAEIHPA